jgi:hypothetical protein
VEKKLPVKHLREVLEKGQDRAWQVYPCRVLKLGLRMLRVRPIIVVEQERASYWHLWSPDTHTTASRENFILQYYTKGPYSDLDNSIHLLIQRATYTPVTPHCTARASVAEIFGQSRV